MTRENYSNDSIITTKPVVEEETISLTSTSSIHTIHTIEYYAIDRLNNTTTTPASLRFIILASADRLYKIYM